MMTNLRRPRRCFVWVFFSGKNAKRRGRSAGLSSRVTSQTYKKQVVASILSSILSFPLRYGVGSNQCREWNHLCQRLRRR